MTASPTVNDPTAAPSKLEEVVTPGSLASFVAPSAWAPLRELAAKLEQARENECKVREKIGEVEGLIWSAGARRFSDVTALADAALRGEVPAGDAEPQRDGLAALAPDRLRALRDGLQQRAHEAHGEIRLLESRVKAAGRELLLDASKRMAAEYVALLSPVGKIHRELDAAHQLLAAGGVPVVPARWREDSWRAPVVIDRSKVKTIVPNGMGTDEFLAVHDDGRGVPGATAAWREAFKAATGLAFE